MSSGPHVFYQTKIYKEKSNASLHYKESNNAFLSKKIELNNLSLTRELAFDIVVQTFLVTQFSSFWISRLFDLGNLNGLKNGTRKYFENGLKSMQIFQRLMRGMNRR